MALQKQTVPMSFSQGIDTKTDPKQVAPGKLLLLKNAHFQKTKSLLKRNGYEAYTTAVQGSILPVSTGISVFNYKKEILLQDKNNLLSFSPDQNWVTKSINLRNFDYSVKPVQFDSVSKSSPVGSYDPVNDLEFYAYTNKEKNSNLHYTVIEKSTGNIIADNIPLYLESVSNVQVQYLGGKWVVFFTNNLSVTEVEALRYIVVDPATPVNPSAATLITSTLAANQVFDTTKVGNEVFIAASETGSTIKVYKLTAGIILSLRRTLVGPAATFTVGISGFVSTRILVMYSNGSTNTFLKIYDDSNVVGPEPTQYILDNRNAETITAYVDATGNANIFYFHPGNANYPQEYAIVKTTFSAGDIPGIPVVSLCGVSMQSKVFLYNDYLYFFVCPLASNYVNGNQNTIYSTSQYGLYLVGFDFVNFDLCCYQKTESGSFGFDRDPLIPLSNPIRPLPEVSQYTENTINKFLFAYLKKSRTVVLNEQISYLSGVQSLHSFQSTKAADRELVGGSLQFTGGQLWQYDGSTVVEAGFNIYPAIESANQDNVGGGIGTYGATPEAEIQVVGTYEWTDQNGNLHRSAPSDPLAIQITDGTEPNGARPAVNFLGTLSPNDPYNAAYGRTFDTPSITGLQVGDFVTQATIYPAGTTIVQMISLEDYFLVTFSTQPTVAATPGVSYLFARAATGVPNGIFDVTTTNGSKTINGPVGAFRIGQRLRTQTGQPAGVPLNAIVEKTYANGDYDISLAATATVATRVWSPDSRAFYIEARNTSLTNKENISLVLWRTTVNGTIFYRTTSPLIPYENNKKIFSQTILIQDSDKEIISNEQLYTSGGEVENIAPPAFEWIQFYKNRLLGLSKDDKSKLFYSKQELKGYGVEFNDSFELNINAPGGDSTGGGVLDEKLIVFKEDKIYYMLGEGPNPMGLQNDFTPFQLVQSDDAGCKAGESASVIGIPEGLMFKSRKGFYLLNRSLGVDYIGDAVEAYNQFTVVSAKIQKDLHQVRFGLSNGQILVYDYYHKQWSAHEGEGDSLTSNDAENVNGTYHFLNTNGILKKETSAFADSRTVATVQTPTYIPIELDTGWLSFAGIEAFQRIYKAILLGEYKSNHLLTVQVYYDFDETYFDTIPINDVGAPVNVFNYRLFMPRQKCSSIRYKIKETQYLNTIGEGLRLSSISFEVGVKKGLNKIKADKSYG